MTVPECAGSLYFLWDTWEHFRSGDPGYQGWLLVPPLCAQLLFATAVFLLFPRLAWSLLGADVFLSMFGRNAGDARHRPAAALDYPV